METQFEVENIKCGGCRNSIKTALLKLEGVESVSIDEESDTVTVQGNSVKEVIVSKLNDLGYPEKGHNSFTKKAKSYVNCAIGRMTESH